MIITIIFTIIKCLLLLFGAAVLAMSLSQRRLPRGVLEYIIWGADVYIILGWFLKR